VVLSSGKKSDFYVDARRTSLHPEGINLIAEVLWEELSDLNLDAVGGPESGAIPLVTGLIALSYRKGRPLRGFFVRKETKAHGMMRRIEGCLKPGDQVALIEDVVTTGATTLSSVKALEAENCKIVRIIVLVDREEGAREYLQENGYQLSHIFTRSDF
jgi:orotate phosphoribosyltransferase